MIMRRLKLGLKLIKVRVDSWSVLLVMCHVSYCYLPTRASRVLRVVARDVSGLHTLTAHLCKDIRMYIIGSKIRIGNNSRGKLSELCWHTLVSAAICIRKYTRYGYTAIPPTGRLIRHGINASLQQSSSAFPTR